jgi:hypothetical protein
MKSYRQSYQIFSVLLIIFVTISFFISNVASQNQQNNPPLQGQISQDQLDAEALKLSSDVILATRNAAQGGAKLLEGKAERWEQFSSSNKQNGTIENLGPCMNEIPEAQRMIKQAWQTIDDLRRNRVDSRRAKSELDQANNMLKQAAIMANNALRCWFGVQAMVISANQHKRRTNGHKNQPTPNPTSTPTPNPTSTPTPNPTPNPWWTASDDCEKNKCKIPSLDEDAFKEVRLNYSNTICDAKQVAGLVFERYGTGLPIGILRVSNFNTPTYLLLLQGTELENSRQGTSLMEDYLEGESKNSYYRRAVMKALRSYGIRNANIIIAGHSLGGIVAQNLITDPEFYELGLKPIKIITFGAFGNKHERLYKPGVDIAKQNTIRFEAVGDTLVSTMESFGWNVKYGNTIKISGCSGQVSLKNLIGDHSNYPNCNELQNYDALGNAIQTRQSATCLEIDQESFEGYPVPNSRIFIEKLLNQTSEDIGEKGMQREAKQLGYQTLLSPSEGSYPQGYDGVYFDCKTCTLVIGEAKGGYNGKNLCSILGNYYGFRQGTINWALEAAKRVTKSRTAKDKELYWAIIIGQYLKKTTVPIRVEVFHTENINGRPGKTKHYITDNNLGCNAIINCECK